MFEKAFVPDHPYVATSLDNIAQARLFIRNKKADTITLAGTTLDGRQVYFIDFDVSITVSHENTDGAGGKMRVEIIAVVGKKDSSSSSNAPNKISSVFHTLLH